MIQVTKWLNPKSTMYRNDKEITLLEWITLEAERLENDLKVDTKIKKNDLGEISLFRTKMQRNFYEKNNE